MNKDKKLKDLITSEIDEIFKNDALNQIREMQDTLNQLTISIPSVSISSEALESIKRFNENYISTAQTLASSIQKEFELNITPLSDSLSFLSINIQNALNSIDWNQLAEGLKVQLENYELIMKKYDPELWAIDRNLLDFIDSDEEEQLPSSNDIEEYIDNQLNIYMNFFRREEMFSKYISLIEQSFSAYQAKQYALASFPLLAIVEGVITNKFQEYEIDPELKPKLQKKKKQLYVKLSDYVQSNEDEIAVSFLFLRRVFFVYQELFKPSWGKHPEHINRNWIMHGIFDYDKISKKDVLRLFQLLKAAEILKDITFEDIQ